VVIDGKRYSHVIDARTGMPLTDRIQVTVVARDGLTSDPLSTGISIVGPGKGRALAARYPGTKVYIRFAN
jgi:thiamine biosynthesis lipoprotein